MATIADSIEDINVGSEEERVFASSQWKLVWRRFRRHRIAVIATVIILFLYTIALFAETFAIHEPHQSTADRAFMSPQPVRLDGFRPYVYGFKSSRDPETLAKIHEVDKETKNYIQIFARGYDYKLLGVISTNWHLVGLKTDERPIPLYLLGTDRMGRDMWSRIMLGTRISMSIGLIGVLISLFLGILLGGISGYKGGRIDLLIQRVIELIRSMPTIPLWLALSAAIPQQWSIIRVYFAITIILSLIGWTTLAREVRGRFLSMREEDFVIAARLYGTSPIGIIFRHMLPSFFSHIIAATTLAIPGIIIAETALSFLGLGMRPPAISWGVLMFESQNLESVAQAPWLLLPGLFVIITVLAFNFMGDGIRDAADPYAVQRR
ncbi:MAG: ABC transporter permease [Pirellulaceae bacterium]|nr:ABC transporter permease [Pirellulaceae bacterium]